MQNRSIEFFDRQFRSAPAAAALKLNPFETTALPFLQGDVLDIGCGMGNLACAAAARGCRVTAVDASPAAVAHLRQRAHEERLAVSAIQADLRDYPIEADYDTVVSIGLLMFFDCPTAYRVLAELQQQLRPGGCFVLTVLVEGTTYDAMFEPASHCLFQPADLLDRFAGWETEQCQSEDFEAPGQTLKRFLTLVARKPRTAT
jgi:tellurite methyltransferase